jgi:hypothetical protein
MLLTGLEQELQIDRQRRADRTVAALADRRQLFFPASDH